MCAFREIRQAGRADAYQHPLLPPPREGASGGVRCHLGHGGRCSLQIPGHEYAHAPGGTIRRRLRWQRRPPRQGSAAPSCSEAAPNIHIGIDWLGSIAFKHIDKIGERVLIIGVGTPPWTVAARRDDWGAGRIKVIARRPRGFFKASSWELEDAEEEGIEILVDHVRSASCWNVENWSEWNSSGWSGTPTPDIRGQPIPSFLPCDDAILAIGQESAFPWIERDIGIEFGEQRPPRRGRVHFYVHWLGVFFGGENPAPRGRRTSSFGPSPMGTKPLSPFISMRRASR